MAMDLQTLHTDGANFYQYLRGNPFMGSDPLGLSSDPFDMVDDFITTSASERAAFLSNVGNGMKSAAIMAATIASFLPIPGANIAGELALYALGEQDWQTTAINIGTGFIPGAAMLSKLAKIRHGAVDIAMKSGGGLRGGSGDGIQRAVQQLKRACGCFTGPTQVWTDRGLLPIADVQVGDFVLAHNDETGELSFREVLKTYVRQGAPIVLVTLMAVDPAMGNTLTTIETTEEHPFLVEATANGDPTGWTRVDDLSPGDTVKQLDGLSPGSVVVSVQFTSRREQVHNLEVEGLHTYLVGADGVVVHNGGLDPFKCWSGLSRNWSKHAPEMERELMLKAKNTPTGPPQGVWRTTPEQVATLLAQSVQPGKPFNGAVPIPSDWAKAFQPGTGAEIPVNMVRIIWDGRKIEHMYPYVP